MQSAINWAFSNPTQVGITHNLTATLSGEVAKYCVSRQSKVLIATGRTSAQKCGYTDLVLNAVRQVAVPVVFEGVEPDPPPAKAAQCAHMIRTQRIEVVVALGGGSVIDFCKVATSFRDYEGDGVEAVLADAHHLIPQRAIPLVAIPTTAGTGSEVTPYAVLTGQNNRKLFSISKHYYPTVGIIAPELYSSVPPVVIQEVGMDAFTHALEALWSKRASAVSDAYAIHALSLFDHYLVAYYRNPADKLLAEKVAIGAMLAGLAFANAYTSICHALSFPIATRYGWSHGKCCSLTAVACAQYNVDIEHESIQSLLRQINLESAKQLPAYIQTLRDELEDTDTLRTLGVDDEALSIIIKEAYPDMLHNNIKLIDEDQLYDCLIRF